MTNKVKEAIGFDYSLTEILLCTFILLGLNMFHEKYLAKSKLKTYLEYSLMILLSVYFVVLVS